MGLDATVMCNCLKEGRAAEPPFPRDWLFLDEDGQLSLRPEHDSHRLSYALLAWMEDACGHPGMNYAREHIANWAGYRAFLEVLGQVGWAHFPVLRAGLPDANGGLMPAESAMRARLELAYLRSRRELARTAFLVDTATGEPLQRHIAAYDGVFIWAGDEGLEVGVGETQFFVREAGTHRPLFRARWVRQTPGEPAQDGRQPAELLDLDTGVTFSLPSAVRGPAVPLPGDPGRWEAAPFGEFHVEVRPVTPEHFEYVLGPLTRIFRASVATGNPVRWC